MINEETMPTSTASWQVEEHGETPVRDLVNLEVV